MTQGGYLHLPGVSEVLLEMALLGADAGQRREVVHRRDVQWCQNNNRIICNNYISGVWWQV